MKKGIISFLILTVFITCNKNQDCPVGGYSFILPIEVDPMVDTISIGDTLEFVSKFSNEIYDKNSNKYYKLKNWKFYPKIIIDKLDTNPSIADVNLFTMNMDTSFSFNIFNYSNGTNALKTEYLYQNNQYYLKYKLVPRSSGLFVIRIGPSVTKLDSPPAFEGQCKNENIEAKVKLMNGDGNYSLIQLSKDSNYIHVISWDDYRRFKDFGGFCVYVAP